MRARRASRRARTGEEPPSATQAPPSAVTRKPRMGAGMQASANTPPAATSTWSSLPSSPPHQASKPEARTWRKPAACISRRGVACASTRHRRPEPSWRRSRQRARPSASASKSWKPSSHNSPCSVPRSDNSSNLAPKALVALPERATHSPPSAAVATASGQPTTWLRPSIKSSSSPRSKDASRSATHTCGAPAAEGPIHGSTARPTPMQAKNNPTAPNACLESQGADEIGARRDIELLAWCSTPP